MKCSCYKRPHFIFLILYFVFFIFPACSLQKQIARSAKENVLDASALQTAHVGISIYEPATNKYWYNYQGDHYFVPASNTKIPTCYAAMKYLGDSLVGLRYKILNDTLIEIAGTADPTLLHPDYRKQPIFDFLKQFRAVLIRNKLFLDFLGSGWSWNDYQESYMVQRSVLPVYGNLVRFKWTGNRYSPVESIPDFPDTKISPDDDLTGGFDVYKRWDANTFFFRNGKNKTAEIPFRPDIKTISELLADTLKARVEFDYENSIVDGKKLCSQPTDSLLRPMMHRSDNFFAEQTLLMISNERLGIMNDEKIIDTLLKTDFKDLPQKPRWVDGSGLSRYNLFTPQDLVTIFTKMKNDFGMDRIKTILPTGGEGTFHNYYQSEKDYIYAKTGTLSGVVSISGFLFTKKNKLIVFSVLVNNHNSSATDVRRAVEKFLRGVRNKY